MWPYLPGAMENEDKKLPDLLLDKAGNPIHTIGEWEAEETGDQKSVG